MHPRGFGTRFSPFLRQSSEQESQSRQERPIILAIRARDRSRFQVLAKMLTMQILGDQRNRVDSASTSSASGARGGC